MTALDVPIVPKHVWEKVGDFSKFNNDKSFPDRRQRPVHHHRLQGRQYVRLKANKDFWRGAPKFDELVFKYYKDQDAAVAALRKGEVSFVSRPHPAPGAGAEERGRHQGQRRPRPPLLRPRHQPRREGQERQEVRQRQPRAARPAGRTALFHAVDREAIDKVSRGTRRGRGLHPAALRDYFWKPRRPRRSPTTRPRPPGSSTRPATRRTATANGSARTASRRASAIRATPPTPNDKASADLHAGVVGRARHRAQGRLPGDMSPTPGSASTTSPSTAGPSTPTRTSSCPSTPAAPCPPPRGTPADTTTSSATAYDELYAQQIAEYDPAKRADSSSRWSRGCTTTGYMNVMAYPNAVEAYRTDQIKSIKTMPEQPRATSTARTATGAGGRPSRPTGGGGSRRRRLGGYRRGGRRCRCRGPARAVGASCGCGVARATADDAGVASSRRGPRSASSARPTSAAAGKLGGAAVSLLAVARHQLLPLPAHPRRPGEDHDRGRQVSAGQLAALPPGVRARPAAVAAVHRLLRQGAHRRPRHLVPVPRARRRPDRRDAAGRRCCSPAPPS